MTRNTDKFRQKAREILKCEGQGESPTTIEDYEKLIEEYHVHKIELELQQEELVKTNQLLEEQNKRLDDLFENAPMAYFIVDENGIVKDANKRACVLLGCAKDAVKGSLLSKHIDKAYQDAFHFHWLKIREGSENQSVEIRLQGSGKKPVYVVINSIGFMDSPSGQWMARVSATDISATKEADLLRDSERRYRLLFRNMVNGLLVLRPEYKDEELSDFRLFNSNAAFEKLTGLNTHKMEGAPFLHIFPDKAEEILPMIFDTVLKKQNQVIQGLPLNSDTFVNIYSFIPEQGYVALIIEDVTMQVKAENERIKSEQMLKTIFKILPVGVTITNEKGDIIDCNSSSEELLGLKKDEHLVRNFAGEQWRIIRHDFSPMPVEEFASVRALKENRIVENVEMGILKKKGHITWINVSAAPIPLPDMGVAIVYSDITGRVRAQEETEEKFRNIVQNSTDAIAVVNPDGFIIEWNKGCANITGYVREEAIGKNFARFISGMVRANASFGDVYHRLYKEVELALNQGESRWFGRVTEAEITDRKGAQKTLQNTVFPVKSSQGYLLGIVSRDISHAKQTERMLKVAKEKAEDASQAKSRFLASISHEIRTPLNAILGFTQILKGSGITDKPIQGHLAGIEKSSKALMALINDILDLSRLEAGKMELAPKPLNLRHLIHDVKQIFSLKAANKGIEVFTHTSLGLPEKVILDEIRLRQVLFNLVGNAVKFTHQGSITISVKSCVGQPESGKPVSLVISVSDTGVGIDPEDHQSIFDPFYQKDPEGYSGQEGTGLGLAISKRFVEMMGGKIRLNSAKGNGSEFSVFLPDVQVSPQRSASARFRNHTHTKSKEQGPLMLSYNDMVADIRKEITDKTGSVDEARRFGLTEIFKDFEKISDILGFDEILEFATSLDVLAQKHKLTGLSRFATALKKEAHAFNVIAINEMLSAFEKLKE